MDAPGNTAVTVPLAEHIYVAGFAVSILSLLAAQLSGVDLILAHHTRGASPVADGESFADEPLVPFVLMFHSRRSFL
jgi:hypothetical protein